MCQYAIWIDPLQMHQSLVSIKITIISAVSVSCGSVFVLQIVCWPFLQRFVCSSADKLSETATSGGNCRRGAYRAMLWNTVQSVQIQRTALKYSAMPKKIQLNALPCNCFGAKFSAMSLDMKKCVAVQVSQIALKCNSIAVQASLFQNESS